MTKRQRYLLEQALDDNLTPNEREDFETLVRNDASFARQFEQEQRLHQLAADAAPASFEDHFAHRVLQRLRTAPADAAVPFEAALMTLLRRLAPVPLTVAGVLASYNAYVGAQYLGVGASFMEVLFGLPPITVDTLLGL
jgi:ferric-dicitrate binding protein FerR (iron transport regulator)